jgi:prepilin-type N-terminal cleavage/methylation domain-containing protein
MSRWRRFIGRALPVREATEAGFTLIELMVSIILMSAVGAGFLAATTSIFDGIHKQQGVVDAVDGNRRVLQTLDKQVRYASAINTPGAGTDGNFYVEYLWTKTSPTTVDVQTCTQWRLNPTADVLQSRSWTSGTTTPSAWSTAETNVVNNPATDPPFVLAPPVPTPTGVVLQFQEMQVKLIASRDQGNVTSTSTYTALNSQNGAALSTPVCQLTGVTRS